MDNKVFRVIGVICFVMLAIFFLSAPLILVILNSPWWLAMYLVYVWVFLDDQFEIDMIEEEEDEA